MPWDLPFLFPWISRFPVSVVSALFLLLPFTIEIPVLNANSVDPDPTPRIAGSNLDLRCWLMSILWDARHKLVYLFMHSVP